MDGNGTGSNLRRTFHIISTTGSASEGLDPQTIFEDPGEAYASKGAKAGSPNKGNWFSVPDDHWKMGNIVKEDNWTEL